MSKSIFAAKHKIHLKIDAAEKVISSCLSFLSSLPTTSKETKHMAAVSSGYSIHILQHLCKLLLRESGQAL